MYYLFLDDERMPHNVTWIDLPNVSWYIVRSYKQFVDYITEHGLPIFVTFDHDLADEHYVQMLKDSDPDVHHSYGSEKTGYDCVKWLVDYCADNDLKFPEYTVHSMNHVGATRINNYITNAKKHLNI